MRWEASVDGEGMTEWASPSFERRGWGLPGWGAVLLAVVFTVAGAVADLWLTRSIGRVFQVAYALGCVLAVCTVRRRDVFAPIIQPPLVMAVVVPLVIIFDSDWAPGGNLVTHLLAAITPVLANFLVQAGVTVATVVIGLVRIILQRGRTSPG